VVYDHTKTIRSEIFSFGVFLKIVWIKDDFCQELTHQDEHRHGKKSEGSRIHGNSWNRWEPDISNIWRCRRWGKWTRSKRENWLVFRVCGWEWLWRIFSSKTRVLWLGAVEEKGYCWAEERRWKRCGNEI